MRNYNIEDLYLESDGGFILGQSILGVDPIRSAQNSWEDIKAEFTYIDLSMSVAQEKGLLFRPEVATLTLKTKNVEFLEGTRGRKVRLRYGSITLFVGKVTTASLSVDKFSQRNIVTLKAVDITAGTNSYIQANFTAPSESVADRVLRLAPDALVTNCDRIMANKPLGNYKLSELLQEASDTQLARFHVNPWGQLVMDGGPAPAPLIHFSDDKPTAEEAAGMGRTYLDYSGLTIEESPQHTITGIVVEVGDPALKAYKVHPDRVLDYEESYSPSIPYSQGDVNAWAASFPVRAATDVGPTSLRVMWQPGVDQVELLDRIAVTWEGREYDCAVVGISHSISPSDEPDAWSVDFDLVPGHLVQSDLVLAPSPVRNFTAGPRTNFISLSWSPPLSPGNLTGYEIRYAVGKVAPVDRQSGTLLVTLDFSRNSYIAGGLNPSTRYSFSIWAITADPNVASSRVTATSVPLPK